MKLPNIFFGIESGASTHPCPSYKFSKEKMQNFHTHSELQLILTKLPVKKKSKISAAFYINCVNRLLVDLLDNVKVIEILAPMQLYLLSRNINRI